MNSSIFNSEIGKLTFRIILPYLGVMALFCCLFDGWFAREFIFSVEDEGPAKMQRYLTVHDPAEVPVFGNSRTNNAIDPALLAAPSWNYGINGSDSELLRYLLQNELASTRKTPIVIGIDPQFFFINEFGDALDYVPLIDDPSIRDFLHRQDRFEPYYRIPTLRYYGGFERFLHRYLVKKIAGSGFCKPSRGASLCSAQLDAAAVAPVTDPTRIDPTNFANAAWLATTIQQHPGRCFVFAELPFYRSMFLAPAVLSRFRRFQAHIARLPNVVWMQADQTEVPIGYFQNFTHLNTVGAQWYSSLLRRQLDALTHCP